MRPPGVYFLDQAAPAARPLPRMDVAAFVGFAASGPLHTPVALEGMEQFRDLFGGDVVLARDPVSGLPLKGLLGPSVEAFFRNGGRRCWVVRVADEQSAETQGFRLPGLYRPGPGDSLSPVTALARSPGTWADGLRISTVLEVEVLGALEPDTGGAYSLLSEDGGYSVRLGARPARLRPGDLVEAVLEDDPRLSLFLFVDRVRDRSSGVQLHARVGYWMEIAACPGCGEGWLRLDESCGRERYRLWLEGSPPPAPRLRLLYFGLYVWNAGELHRSLTGLAFSSRHPRCWCNLPADEELFALRIQGPPDPEREDFARDVESPRFPLAGERQGSDAPVLHYLPLGMETRLEPEMSAPPLFQWSSSARDGLTRFTSDLFLDRDLADAGIGALVTEAERKRHVLRRPLKGIHSLMPVEEISLVAIPDAGHRAWGRGALPSPGLLDATWLEAPIMGDPGTVELSWGRVSSARAYWVESDQDVEFSQPGRTRIEANDRPPSATLTPERSARGTHYFRVRAERFGRVGPWSNTRAATLPPGHFEDCVGLAATDLDLRLDCLAEGEPPGSGYLVWGAAGSGQVVAGADTYEVQRATDAEFRTASRLYLGSEVRVALDGNRDKSYFYRARAWRSGLPGPWSNTRVFPTAASGAGLVQAPSEYDSQDLLAVQLATMRLCAALGDRMALLSFPRHYLAEQILEHRQALLPGHRSSGLPLAFGSGETHVRGLSEGETAAPGFAALFHPWLAVSVSGGSRSVPPDGAVAGSMALRAYTRGAWIAPANQPLRAVLALASDFDVQQWVRLGDAGVNLLRREPRGFLLLSGDTLSQDEEWRPINVRRLLILLRRMTLREGAVHIFEPHDRHLRNRVRQRFENMLGRMYAAGAFAGSSPRQAFRVVTGDSVNPRSSMEQGRFVVELRIAPSLPMRFIQVRLVHGDRGNLAIREL